MFSETYPEVLKNVSFMLNNNIGILNNWNKYCKTSKENPYFVYTVLKNSVNKTYFPDDQILPTSVLNLVKYISSCITVKWTEDEFVIKFKKVKDENGKFKDKFNSIEYYILAEKATLDKKKANQFLKWSIEYLKKFYNDIVINDNKNKN